MASDESTKVSVSINVDDGKEIKPMEHIKKVASKLVKKLKKREGVDKGRKDEAALLISTLLSNFDKPSEIQRYSWPALASGYDLVGIAETGSGKTLAFLVPLLAKLMMQGPGRGEGVQMLVVTPTRELAIQIHKVLEGVSDQFGIPSACIYGGTSRKDQVRAVKLIAPRVIVGTPGRLLDLLNDGVFSLSNIKYWVLDEADRMLDMGFEPEIRQMASAMTDPQRQTVMFSATWPSSIQTLASRYLRPNHVAKITIQKGTPSSSLKAASSITQIVEVVEEGQKNGRIIDLLKHYHGSKDSRTILFVLYKREAVRVEQLCKSHGYDCVALHGDMTQPAREAAYTAFKSGSASLLIATDVAARGLDIPSVTTVLNYTFPLTIEDYVHRIGRTGRAGLTGTSHTLFTSNESKLAAELVAQLKASAQKVPQKLLDFGGTTKRKEHAEYGAFYRDIDPSSKAKHFKFDEDSDE